MSIAGPDLELARALHKTRHRTSESGWTPDPCGACEQEAVAVRGALSEGWRLVGRQEWRDAVDSGVQSGRTYTDGYRDGAAAERERIIEAVRMLPSGS